MDTFETELMTEALLGGAPVNEVAELLSENYFQEEKKTVEMQYLYLMEQYFDDCSVYAFHGWREGLVLSPPDIGKFWITIELGFPPSLDLSGARRLLGPNKQNKVKIKKDETQITIKLSLLRSVLDRIEQNNRIEAKQDAEQDGYQDEPEQNNQMQQPAAAPGGF